MLKKIIITAVLAVLPITAQAADSNALQGEAVSVMKGFGGALKNELVTAIKKDGPIHAVGACNEKAPGIAKAKSVEGWSVGRTSLKLRNAENRPDEWEMKVLQSFEERKKQGENPDKIAFGEVVEQDGKKVYRFMKAIPTAEICLKCHGNRIEPDVAAKLDGLYPGDKARGFKPGDIRGAFTLSKGL